jgi:SAM-dependent methyltransferase
VEDLNRATDEMKRILRKDGIAIFFLPNDGSILWRILRPFWTIYYETVVSRQDSPKSHVHSFDLERFGKTFGNFFELLEVGKINLGMEIYAICKHPLI